MSQRVLLIVNPVAGKMRGKAALYPLTEAFCGAGYEVTAFVTAQRGDAERVARESGARHDRWGTYRWAVPTILPARWVCLGVCRRRLTAC